MCNLPVEVSGDKHRSARLHGLIPGPGKYKRSAVLALFVRVVIKMRVQESKRHSPLSVHHLQVCDSAYANAPCSWVDRRCKGCFSAFEIRKRRWAEARKTHESQNVSDEISFMRDLDEVERLEILGRIL